MEVEFGEINGSNVEELRKINTACFPVQYQPSFYRNIVEGGDNGLCKFAYVNEVVVGAVCCRIEPLGNGGAAKKADDGTEHRDHDCGQRIYIMTLGVLASYRNRGIGTKLIQSVLEHYDANKDGDYAAVKSICLHVQISNKDAMNFYMERFGFTKGPMIKNYYRRVDPPHCYILQKDLKE